MTTATLLAATRSAAPATATVPPRAAARRSRLWLGVLALALIAGGVTVAASTRTSPTFDEIIMMGAGARGWHTGDWELQREHPPLMQYVYGLPVFLAHPNFPEETPGPKAFNYRYEYSRALLWTSGNDPERLVVLGRLGGAVCVVLLVLVAYGFTAGRFGNGAGLLAALLTAFLPDVLAHGGVAYNDLPLALLLLASLWALDVAARRPSWRTGALAGLVVALALAVKFSAIAIAPMAVLLVVAEAAVRRDRAAWARRLGIAVAAGLVALYLVLVTVYRGDLPLAEFRYGLNYTLAHVSAGHGAPGYLLGEKSMTGWWYFFPLAFLYKTPAALHALIGIAVAGGILALRGRSWRDLLASPARTPAICLLVFGAALLRSHLDIGFRYALPLLPPLCVLTAAGVAVAWRRAGRAVRGGIVALALAFAASSLSWYPYFLSYISEYGPGRDHGDEVLLDSSLDWGQGLLALRDYMGDQGIDRVYLSYFGSGVPAGYGIRYVPLLSYMPLQPVEPPPVPGQEPNTVVISATNLHGIYLPADPFGRFRELKPDTVLAHTLFVYRFR